MLTLFDRREAVASAVRLRPYQAEALAEARRLYLAGIARQLLVSATGTGKTVVFASLPGSFPELAKEGMLVLVHRKELASQAADKIRWVNPHLDVQIEMADERAWSAADVVVASVQTLGRKGSRRIRKFARRFGIVVVDEAHHCAPKSQYERVLDFFGVGPHERFPTPSGRERLLLGVTATPNRHDGKGLAAFFDDITANYDIRWGVEQGWLTDILATRVETGTDLSGVRTRGGDFALGDLEAAINTHERHELIVKGFCEHGGSKAIAFCAGVKQAYELAAEFRRHGIDARGVDGTMEKDERDVLIQAFRDSEFPVLCNVGIATEGFDVPDVDTVLMARPTKSTPLYVQMMGRGTRPVINPTAETPEGRRAQIAASEKPCMRVIDFTDNTGTHSLVTAPKLFGLDEHFDTKGKSVVKAVQRVEALEKENPGKALRKAKTLDEVEIVAKTVSVWDVAATPADLEGVTELHWMGLSEGVYQLVIPGDKADDPIAKPSADPRPTVVTLEADRLGRFRAAVTRPKTYDPRTGYATPEQRHVSEKLHGSIEEAVAAVDAWARAAHPDKMPLITRGQRWQEKPATEAQLKLLKRLKVHIPAGEQVDRGTASRLITAAKARQRAARPAVTA